MLWLDASNNENGGKFPVVRGEASSEGSLFLNPSHLSFSLLSGMHSGWKQRAQKLWLEDSRDLCWLLSPAVCTKTAIQNIFWRSWKDGSGAKKQSSSSETSLDTRKRPLDFRRPPMLGPAGTNRVNIFIPLGPYGPVQTLPLCVFLPVRKFPSLLKSSWITWNFLIDLTVEIT